MSVDLLFRAIKRNDIELAQEILKQGIKVNTLSLDGSALYYSIKCYNFQISKLLVENNADCNIVQLDFDCNGKHPNDGLQHSCFISTPIDLLCLNNEVNNDQFLAYLLEQRPMINEDMINNRILYCAQLYDDKNAETLFDYVASYFLRINMYDHVSFIGNNASLTLAAATLNINTAMQNSTMLTDGGTHEAFFTLIIRSLFEELVRFKLRKGSQITSESQYTHILRELLRSLEAYHLLLNIHRISHEQIQSLYPAIVNNIIIKLKNMKCKEEYTLPVKWNEHAICINFIRETDSIVIRIDNLNVGEKREHKVWTTDDQFLVLIPKIIGEIPLKKLDDNREYFLSLIRSMKTRVNRSNGMKIFYHNDNLKYLDTSRIAMFTKQLMEQSRNLKCFIQQAESNCFIKSHEPGFAIRSNDYNIYQQIITILRVYTMKLTTKDILSERNQLEQTLIKYWQKEATIDYRKIQQLLICLENSQQNDLLTCAQISDDDLQLHEEIGSGGFGIVYRATWISRHFIVAVKKLCLNHLNERAEKDFIRELAMMNRIRCPYIVGFLGACIDKGKYALIMEYMSLGSLYKVLHEDRLSLTWSERMSIALQSVKGINYLHQCQPPILHRDVKSLNFLLEKAHDGFTTKVCDFGLSLTRNETSRQTKSSHTSFVYTLQWTAPEILRLEPYTDKSDIYSLGVVYWELVTNQIPYSGYSDSVVREFVLAGDRLKIPQDIPSSFRTIIEKCWAHGPNNRPSGSSLIPSIIACIDNAQTYDDHSNSVSSYIKLIKKNNVESEALSETRPAYQRPSSTSTQKYNRPSTDNTIPPSSMAKGDLFKKIMTMMSAPTRSEDGRLMDEDGYYNEDGSRSWV
ncbi:unnamed protein product [Adineta ricciae]|uniref:Protein kinase domain-containing protein n=2 Tax=Adineta ricciae TaxID=249248 RepID=A0A815S702_ADIRI|nr:unnamed protein product [Adineta ricciae]